jgi:hypothetical protein
MVEGKLISTTINISEDPFLVPVTLTVQLAFPIKPIQEHFLDISSWDNSEFQQMKFSPVNDEIK